MKKGIFVTFTFAFALLLVATGCKRPYKKYDNMEVLENSYSGDMIITSTGTDPAADFTGKGDSGTYSFVWDNPKEKAHLNYDITTNSGSVQFIIRDARGDEVLNKTLTSAGPDTYSGVSDKGKKGKWLITVIMKDFNGDGSFSINPGD